MNHTIPERKDTDPRFHWHIEDYFKTDADWEASYTSLEKSLPELTAFAGKLADSAEALLSCLKKNEALSLQLDHIYTYASMRMHEDSANAFYQGLASRAELLLIPSSPLKLLPFRKKSLPPSVQKKRQILLSMTISSIPFCARRRTPFPRRRSICLPEPQSWAAHHSRFLPC